MRRVIGIDVGTTHIKSILFADDGRALLEQKTATPLSADAWGSVYNSLEIWEIVKNQLEMLCTAAEAPIDGISITGMAEAGLIVNRLTGQEETDILPWFEKRTEELAACMNPSEEKERFAVTGLHNSFKYGIYKFLWFLEHGKIDRQNAVWLSMCDYIAFKLTGIFVTDPGFAARTYVYDILQGCWDEEAIAAKGLHVRNFPRVVPSGKCCGSCGFLQRNVRIPVAIAGHDHICAAFGLSYHKPESICDSAGTAETYVGRIRELPQGGFSTETGVLYGPYADGGWFFMANVPSSGHSVEWFRKKLQMEELTYEEMNAALLKQEKTPTGILYFPYLTGMGSPWYESAMCGSLLGLREKDDGIKILKAIMEGIQYQAAWLMELLENAHGIKGKEIICAGGSAKNKVLMQLKADILDRRVSIPREAEATLCGAAALFWHKNGQPETAAGFLARALDMKEEFIPDANLVQKYKQIKKEQYLPMAEMLRNYYCKTWRN